MTTRDRRSRGCPSGAYFCLQVGGSDTRAELALEAVVEVAAGPAVELEVEVFGVGAAAAA